MCSPSYYGIEYEINPWMSRASPEQIPNERGTQWKALRRLLEEQLAVDVRLDRCLSQGLPDMVFTANAGLSWNEQVHREQLPI